MRPHLALRPCGAALRSAEDEGADWVARRELVERLGQPNNATGLIERTWSPKVQWDLVGSEAELHPERGLSALLSDVADRAYTATPRVANEMIARRELTSQGAKARRFLMDAMLAKPETECFGIEGYGPEKAMYEAIFRSTGIHRQDANGHWGLQAPTDRRWKSVWRIMNSVLDDAITARINLVEVTAQLTSPPVGLKEGVIPLLMVASLVVHRDEVALYEHGTSFWLSMMLLQNDLRVISRISLSRTPEPKAASAALLSTLWSRGSGSLAVLERQHS